jgi:hypothetical protein
MLFARKWMELEDIMLSKGGQVQKYKGCIFQLVSFLLLIAYRRPSLLPAVSR